MKRSGLIILGVLAILVIWVMPMIIFRPMMKKLSPLLAVLLQMLERRKFRIL